MLLVALSSTALLHPASGYLLPTAAPCRQLSSRQTLTRSSTCSLIPDLANPAQHSSAARRQQHCKQLPRSALALGPVATPPEPLLADELEGKAKLQHTLRVGSFFFLWYAFNIGYNLYTKWTLNVIPIPWTLAVAQLVAGIPYVALLWLTGLRKAPRLNAEHMRTVFPVAMAHTFAHLAAVVSLGAGAVGFVQIVKAAEPLFTAGLSALILGQVMAWPVYLTLIPVVAGVALASLQELSFSATAFVAAMCSNTCAATRSVIGKRAMGKDKGENMDAGNLYAVMTIMATLVLTPLAAVVEGPKLPGLWAAAIKGGATSASMARHIAFSGIFFYLYNEVSVNYHYHFTLQDRYGHCSVLLVARCCFVAYVSI
jgi:solute carrier family 35, member E1